MESPIAALTTERMAPTIAAMRARALFLFAIASLATSLAGCGLFYQAGIRLKTAHMSDQLKPGESMTAIHQKFGEPDIRQYPDDTTEVWSYAYKPNTNDVTAALLYTSTKEGDRGTFLDLKFVDGRLVSWTEAEHTMPPKERSGFGAGISGAPIGGPGSPNGASTHY